MYGDVLPNASTVCVCGWIVRTGCRGSQVPAVPVPRGCRSPATSRYFEPRVWSRTARQSGHSCSARVGGQQPVLSGSVRAFVHRSCCCLRWRRTPPQSLGRAGTRGEAEQRWYGQAPHPPSGLPPRAASRARSPAVGRPLTGTRARRSHHCGYICRQTGMQATNSAGDDDHRITVGAAAST